MKAVRDAISRLWFNAHEKGLERACEWITSRHFARYVTGVDFSYPLKPAHVLNSAEEDEDCALVIQKLALGHEVRRFSPALLESKGPDFDHLLDWITEIKATSPLEYEKLPRMTVPIVCQKADRWTEALGKKAAGQEGVTSRILDVDRHMSWHELTDRSALLHEGSLMSHCVGGSDYAYRVTAGKARIFSLRFNEVKPILTLELVVSGSSLTLAQIQKKANGGLPIALCDAVTALLNLLHVRDFHQRARIYGLVCKDTLWSSVYDLWSSGCEVGRNVLRDGSQTLYMCLSDPSKPLLLTQVVASAGDERESEARLHVRAVNDLPPHYVDQAEASDIVNSLKADPRHTVHTNIEWLRRDPISGRELPKVDCLERHNVGSLTYYVETGTDGAERYLLPHSGDPGRIVMEACKDRFYMRAKVCETQTVSRSQISRCLVFLDDLDVSFLGPEDNSDNAPETRQFQKTYDLVRVGRKWKAFGLDKQERKAKLSDGSWEWSDYLVRYQGRSGRLDVYLDGQHVIGSHSFGLRPDECRELTASLNAFRLRGCATAKLETSYGREDPVLLIMCDGKWSSIRTIRDAERYLHAIQGIPAKAKISREAIYASLLDFVADTRTRAAKAGKRIDHADSLRSALLPLWFNEVSDFSKYQSRKSWLYHLGTHADYPVTERLCDLYDCGYRPGTTREIARLKKALRELVSSYPRGRIHFPHEEEFSDVAIRWHGFMPKSALNKISGVLVRFTTWEATRDAAAAYQELLGERSLYGTRLGKAIWDRAKRILGDQDLTKISTPALKSHARLCDRLARDRWVYVSEVDAIETMLDTLMAADLGEDADEFRLINERLRSVVAGCKREVVYHSRTADGASLPI